MVSMAEEKKGNPQFSIRLNQALVDRLKRIGRPLGLSVQEVIRDAIKEYVIAHDPTGEARHPRRQ